ncbi:MAG TPA: sugar ABC transporter substrate-binding protein [Solirubrobacterales bacterium]
MALVAAVVVAGCGSSSSGSSSTEASSSSTEESPGAGEKTESGSNVAAAQAATEEAMEDITEWTGPESSPPVAPDKSIVVIPCAMAAEGCKRQAEGFLEAAKVVGWKTKLIDPAGDPTKENAAIEQAITLHADGIFLVSVDPKSVSGPLAEARKAGIAVVASGTGGPQSKPSPTGLNHEVSLHGTEQGEILGNYIVANSQGKANVAIFDTSESATVEERVEGTKKILEACSGCTISEETNAPVTSLGTELTSRAKALVQANPDIEYIWAGFDGAATNVVEAVTEAGLAEKVAVVSFNGDAQNLEFIRKGQAQTADVGEGCEWAGWAGVDAMNRVFSNETPPADDGVPSKLLTAENLPPQGEKFEGEYDFRKKYEELWKVNG